MNILGTVKSTQLFIRKLMNSVWAVLLLVGLTVYANAQTKDVNIQKMLFVPQTITISVGDVVRWVNKERRQYHSVWFEALGDPEPDYFFPGEVFEKRFLQAGTYPYRCGPHPEMVGTVVVQALNVETSVGTVSPERQKELDYLLKQDCGSCHGMTLKGGLGPSLLSERLKPFSVKDLTVVILEGRPGTPMPPWKGILSEADARWLSGYLKAGSGDIQ